MRKKTLPLIKTNPYLQDPVECDAWLTRSVLSSTAIEGVHAAAARALGVAVKMKKIKGKHQSAMSARSQR